MDLESKINNIINNNYKYFLSLANVNGVGYGYKYINNKNTFEPCLNVFVNNKVNIKSLSKNNIIPKTYMGLKTDITQIRDVKNSNNITIQNSPIEVKKIRPLEGGCDVGFFDASGWGTISCIVKKKIKNGQYDYYILSNNHVLADENQNPIGTLFTQPSNDFQSNPNAFVLANVVAMLDRFIPIKFKQGKKTPATSVDCAIAKLIDNSLISNKIKGIGTLKGKTKAKVGMKVRKFGATTGLTSGEVVSTNVTTFSSGSFGNFYLKNQIYTNIQTDPGDSGAPIVTEDNYIISIHGSKKEVLPFKYYSLSSDINIVLKKLKVELYLS